MDSRMYEELEKTQNTHWWFVGRKKILLSLLDRTSFRRGKVLDIGCGMGVMLKSLEAYGAVYGTDFEDAAVNYCRGFFGEDKVSKGSLPDAIPFPDNSFGLVTCLDVIEHVEDDIGSLRRIHSLLKPGGIALVAVPALKCMWGYNDVMSHHKRRYNREMLMERASEAQFEILRCSYFNFLLFPMAFVVRRLKEALHIEEPDLEVAGDGSFINMLLTKIFSSERFLLSRTNLPYGVSLVAVLKKAE